MPKFAANLSMLYPEHNFLDRFAAAAHDGFSAVEYLFPYAFEAREIAARLRDNGLQQVLFNAPPGDWDGGERGLACLPGRAAEFRASIGKALDYAKRIPAGRRNATGRYFSRAGVAQALPVTCVSPKRTGAPPGIQRASMVRSCERRKQYTREFCRQPGSRKVSDDVFEATVNG